jgi:hypothetical protein
MLLDIVRRFGAAVGCAGGKTLIQIETAIIQLKNPDAANLDDDEDTRLAFHRKCIIMNRLIGLIFRDPHVDLFGRITSKECRAQYEYGAGIKNENFFRSLADLINNNDADEHNAFLPYEGPRPDIYTEYPTYMDTHSLLEHPSKETTTSTTWKDVKVMVDNLKSVYSVMSKNYTQSGNHQHDAMQFTDLALQRTSMRKHLSTLNVYYYFMQLYFNKDTELKGNFTEELQPQFVGQTADSAPAQSGKRKKPDDEIVQVISSNEMQSRMIDDRLNSMNQLQMLQAEIFKMKDEKSDLGRQRHSAMLKLVAAEQIGDKDYIIELLRTTYNTATADIGKLEDSIQAKQN